MGRTLAVVALAAAWVAWWVMLHPHWATNRLLMSVYYCGLPGLQRRCWWRAARGSRSSAGSATCTPTGSWPGAFKYVGLLCVAALSALAQLGGFHQPTPADWGIFAVVALLNAMLVTVFIYLGAEGRGPEQRSASGSSSSWPRRTASWKP